jgi:hypothetical protein
MREGAVRDHMHAPAVDSQLLDQAHATVLGVHDDRVKALVQASLRRDLTRPWLARQHIVGGEH